MTDLPALEGGAPVCDRFLPFGAPSITDAEVAEVVATLRSGWIGTGAKVRAFEEAFAQAVGARNAIAVSSCTAALHLSLLAAGVEAGDEVITTDLTFAATVNVIVHAGARPVLVDVNPVTLNAVPQAFEQAMTERTRAILPVHFGGLPCDLDGLESLANERGVKLIEDCAHAVGAEYRTRPIGSGRGFACFSFYANKNLTTGEGGMITVPDDAIAEELRTWRLHGLDHDAWQRFSTAELLLTDCTFAGFKYNMTDIQASLGLHQLERLPDMLKTRELYAGLVDDFVDGRDDVRAQYRPQDPTEGRHALHLYVLVLELDAFRISRNDIVRALRAENVGAAIHYEPVHRQTYYRRLLGSDDQEFPVASAVGDSILSIPMTPSMSGVEMEQVVVALEKVLDYYRR